MEKEFGRRSYLPDEVTFNVLYKNNTDENYENLFNRKIITIRKAAVANFATAASFWLLILIYRKTKSIRLVGKLFLLFLSRKFLVFVKSFGVLFFRFYEEFLGKFGLRFL